MAELEDVTLDGKPLHSLRVADLKAALEQRGLAKSGQKNALIKRLKGALMLENLQRTSSSHIGLQPNSQIGEEMSQNSFIKQYLAKQQELLRQRMEREAREAAEADDTNSPAGPEEDDHTAANDGTSYLPDKHHIVAPHPSMSRPEVDEGGDRVGGGLPQDPGMPGARRLDVGPAPVAQEPLDVSAGRIWRPSFSQEEAATPSPPRAVASLSVRVVGQPERQGVPLIVPRPQEREGTAPVEAGPAHSMPQLSRSAHVQEESGEDDDEDDDDSDEDDEWGPSSHGRKNVRAPPAHHQPAASMPRSRRKLQPPQHIPPQPQPAHQSPLQLRQPTPPPSPPPELSFPLPDTPKQSPPDQDEPAGPEEGAAPGSGAVSSPPSFQRQESTSSSRSSSPEPPSQRRPGPLSLLVQKMESEGAFDAGRKKEEEEDGDGAAEMEVGEQDDGQEAAGPGVLVFSRVSDDAQSSSGAVVAPVVQGSAQEETAQDLDVVPTVLSAADSSAQETVDEREEEMEEEKSSEQHKEEKEREDWSEEKQQEKEEAEEESEKKKSADLSPVKLGRETSPSRTSASFSHTSPPTPPLPAAKRARMFSEVPPPECLMTPSKPEQVSVVVSGPRHAEAEVTMETEASAAVPEPKEEDDKEMKPKVETEEQAPPQPAREAKETKKSPSELLPSPPPEEGEPEGAREKAKRTPDRRSSSSSSSSSSDSDSESSSSSSSESSPQEKSSPPSRKKDEEEETRRAVDTAEESQKPSRDVKQAAVAEPTGPVAMELEERPESESAVAQPAPQGAPEATESHPDESTTPKAFAARKISITTTKPEGTALEAESGAAASRKRRWGSSTAVTAKKPSISITTESLKSLIPDIKPLQEAVVELHPDEVPFSGDEDSNQQANREDDQGLKIRRTVTQVVPSEGQENGQKEKEEEEEDEEEPQAGAEKEKPVKKLRRDSVSEVAMETQEGDAKKVTPNDSVVRRSISQQKVGVSVTIDDPVRTGRQLSPPRGKVSNIVHICNLVRPFTLGQLKELLNRTGTVVEEGFWIDKIKSHCYVTYTSTEEAVATREALHGVKWPSSNPKVLRVDFCEQDELDFHKGLLTGEDPRVPGTAGRPAAPPPLMPPAREREKEREEKAGGGAAAAAPVPAAAPVRDQWAEREREMERRERTRLEREWDRDKVRDFNRDERGEARRSRSRDRDRRRKERGKSKERRSEKKEKPEEPPAKLLDDLFRKTKAAPCIYWLPLTEEQVTQRTMERAERMKEREKRRKELEEEEKKREEERKERARGREREGGNAGSGAGGVGQPQAERERDREREKEKERERGREKEGEKRRDNRGRPSDSKPAGGSRRSRSRSRRSRSRSNPNRDRRR